MKRMTQINLFAMAVAVSTAVGGEAKETKAQSNALSDQMFVQMDADQDRRVSEKEYVDFGTAYLRKKGKRANLAQLQAKFNGFDLNGDGHITAEDPDYRSPKDLLHERIAGTWTSERDDGKSISFIFMEQGQADVIQNGESMREKARGKMKYRFVHPSRTPTCLDIVVDRGTDSDYYIKCIIEFISEDRMKLKMAAGSGFTVRPRKFAVGLDRGVLILTRS